jgi:hypothetical protein
MIGKMFKEYYKAKFLKKTAGVSSKISSNSTILQKKPSKIKP